MLFPSHAVALRCVDFFHAQVPDLSKAQIRILDLVANMGRESLDTKSANPQLSAVLFPDEHWGTAKLFWQHTGEGISSRRAEYCYELFKEGLLAQRQTVDEAPRLSKGPRRYRQSMTGEQALNVAIDGKDGTQFIEERFGRNLQLKDAPKAKLAIRRRIAGSLTADVALEDALDLSKDESKARPVAGFSEDDIYLYPCGMNAIFNTHRSLLLARGPFKSVNYG